jgi:hypothetical protein
VNDLGAKEIWFWSSSLDASYPSYNPAIHRPEDFRGSWESNMSSPTTGDISNSNRDNSDLPVYDHTYTLYGYNFRRSQAEALHNHGHQDEAIFGHAAFLQDGNSDLFWKVFVGQNSSGNFVTGRCGWTHMPPNTTNHYDYENTTLVSSDIADWAPAGGAMQLVNVNTWGNRTFAWPDGNGSFPQRRETQWYIHWRQSVPGYANLVRLGAEYMTNWWAFKADWDSSIEAGMGLHSPTPTVTVMSSRGERGFGLRLWNVTPNPARSGTTLTLELGRSGRLRVELVDVHGRRLSTVADEACSAGRGTVTWNGRAGTRELSAGVYWLVADFDGEREARRIVVLR